MPEALDQQIRFWLARYLRGEVTLEAFEGWFTPATWDVDDADPVSQGLAGLIALRLAEFSNGDLEEDELRDGFRPLVGSLEPEPVIQFSASGVIPTSVSFGVGKRPSAVSG